MFCFVHNFGRQRRKIVYRWKSNFKFRNGGEDDIFVLLFKKKGGRDTAQERTRGVMCLGVEQDVARVGMFCFVKISNVKNARNCLS